jgi:hypothetical protein
MREIADGEGQYDVRVGASSYAPIVGAFGALSVPAIILVFALPSQNAASATVTFAAGLLVIGMFGSLFGSVGLAAIGAERDPTANLAPAIMYIAVPVATSIISVLGAFEVLAAIYIPDSADLFAIIVVAGGIFRVMFTAFAIADSVSLGPTDPKRHDDYLKKQWLQTRAQSYRWANIIAAIGTILPLLGAGLRVAGFGIPLNSLTINSIIGAGVGVTFLGTIASMLRTAHRLDGEQRGLKGPEAAVTVLAIGGFTLGLVVCLP